jgi:hypothetical protein
MELAAARPMAVENCERMCLQCGSWRGTVMNRATRYSDRSGVDETSEPVTFASVALRANGRRPAACRRTR